MARKRAKHDRLPSTARQAQDDPAPTKLINDLRHLIQSTRTGLAQAVNSALVLLYWQVGERIRSDVLKSKRAAYGDEICSTLSNELAVEFGNGYSRPNLTRMIRFAEVFPDREVVVALSRCLGWSHFVEIIYLKDQLQRDFYAEMCRSFTFVARQKRMVIDGEDFYLDLLFYHRKLRRLVAVELKLERFKAADKGQMELYLRWLEKHEMEPGEETPMGLILCADKGDERIELLQLDQSGIRVAAYLTDLPPRQLLRRKLHETLIAARARLEARPSGGAEGD